MDKETRRVMHIFANHAAKYQTEYDPGNPECDAAEAIRIAAAVAWPEHYDAYLSMVHDCLQPILYRHSFEDCGNDGICRHAKLLGR
jgi:hypothetical protein